MTTMASSSADGDPSYDYTEGASASDIRDVLVSNRHERRHSQHSTYYDEAGHGAMFSGPGQTANPSSVSRMSYMELGRNSDLWTRPRRKSIDSRGSHVKRRGSLDSRTSRHSVEGTSERQQEGNEETESLLSGDIDKSRDKPHSTQPRSMFENFTNIFVRHSTDERRPSLSGRSSSSRLSRGSGVSDHALDTDEELEGEERWGYSSGEEDSDNESTHSQPVSRDNASITPSMNYDSGPPSPLETSQSLPLLGFDSVFDGEARIDMDTAFTLLDPPPPGPPSRQTVYIEDEDTTIRFIGYETISSRVLAWRIGCILSFGIIGLLGHWFPYLWLRWVAKEKAFIDTLNGFVMVEVCSLIALKRPSLTPCSRHIELSCFFLSRS